MKPIIAPTDFSPASLDAVNYAADLAVFTGSTLHLLHIFQLPVVFGDIPVTALSVDDQIAGAEQLLQSIKRQVEERSANKTKIYTSMVVGSAIVQEIQDYCKSIQPSFVVMGAQGHTAVERLLFGSNTNRAMKELSWPLLVVPPKATFKQLHNIGFACDLKKVLGSTPLDEIGMLVTLFNAKLHVIHINTDAENTYSPELILESGLVQEMLQDLHPVYHFVNNANVLEGLSDYVKKITLTS